MKTTNRYIRLLFVFCLLLGIKKGQSQCTASFAPLYGPAGTVTFTNLSTGTTTNTSYFWTFGNSTNSLTPSNTNTTTTTYTSNGTYTVVLTMTVTSPFCISTYTQIIVINNAASPTCSMQVNYTAPNPALNCNGSATVSSVTGACLPVTYSWSSGATGSVVSGLCQGNTYSVVAVSPNGTACCSIISSSFAIPTASCSLVPSFTYTPGLGGTIQFSSTTTGTMPGVTYTWKYGDFTAPGSGVNPSHTYGSNGVYTVILVVNNAGNCIDSTSNTLTVTICPLAASFTYSTGAGGIFSFMSTSTNTSSGTVYSWNFGDGSPPPTPSVGLTSILHTYSVIGTYPAVLLLSNPTVTGCVSSYTQNIVVSTVPCLLLANFSCTISSSGLGTFINTSTGTTGATTYTWNFGDGTTSTLTGTPHQYQSPGNYTVSLTANNNTSVQCISTKTQAIVVPCAMSAGFSHTVGSGGTVSFASTSAITYSNTSYVWDFGDGVYTGGPMPIHTYVNAGAYNVTLRVVNSPLCQDSIVQSVNVTGIGCMANSGFTVVPSGTPQYWNATPAYPWNVTAATWDWGDGSSSNALYTSHVYSVASLYNICLSVTVSCGSTGSTCASYSVFRTQQNAQDMSMVYINILKPELSTGITNLADETLVYTLYPNPNNGNFQLNLTGLTGKPVYIHIYNLVGELVYEKNLEGANGQLVQDISLDQAATGVYFIQVSSGNSLLSKKVIIQKP